MQESDKRENDMNLANNKREKTLNLSKLYDKYGVLIVFLLIFIISSFLSPTFIKTTNLLNVLRQISIVGILSIGMTFVIVSGGIDLSVGSIIALVTVITAGMVNSYGIVPAIIIAVLIGAAVGLLNGLGITMGKMQPFIMTLGMMAMVSGLAYMYSNGTPIMIKGGFLSIGNGFLFSVIPLPAVYFIALLGIAAFIIKNTVFGRYVYSIGSNQEATRLSGVNVNFAVIRVYVLSGVMAAIAGIIYASQMGIGTPVAGTGYETKAITATIVGGASLMGGKGSLLGTFLGACIIGILSNIMNLTGVNPFVQQFLTGVIMVLAVLVRKEN